MSKKSIAIIGGGISGLSFSLCLSKKNFDCTIFEKSPTFEEVGAAISIFPNALNVMDHLGLLEEILETSGKMERAYLKTSKGSILSKSEPQSDYPVLCIHRKDFHDILLRHTPAKLRTNHALVAIQPLDNGQVELSFENGKTRIFDAVIGADGIHSTVRQYIIGDGVPTFRGYNIWRGIVDTDFDIGYSSETYGRGQRVGIVPIKDGCYGWWATCNEALLEDDEPEGRRAKLLRLFGDWHDPIPEFISSTKNILKNSLSDREPTRGWSKGNITLLGDAAHPTTPNLGQGGCMAIEGAYILAKAIDKYGLQPSAFQRYEELQFPRSKRIVQESRKLGQLGQISNPLLAGARNLAFRLTPSSVAMKMIDQYFSYRVTELEI